MGQSEGIQEERAYPYIEEGGVALELVQGTTDGAITTRYLARFVLESILRAGRALYLVCRDILLKSGDGSDSVGRIVVWLLFHTRG